MLTLCLCWIDACLVGVLSDEDVSVGEALGSGWTYMPFNALRASASTRATCSNAICMFCLKSSGEFGSTSVELVVVVS